MPLSAESGPLQAPAPARLLLVEDDETIRETVAEALGQEGFCVEACGDGLQALALLNGTATGSGAASAAENGSPKFDLLVLDVMLPGMGGLDLCRQLRQRQNEIAILVVSARDTETDRVLGLEVGADDYLVKPFGMRELVARCRSLLRRSRQQGEAKGQPGGEGSGMLEAGELQLFPAECRVTRSGQEVNLSPKEYRLLELFMQNPKRVWSRDKLLERIWGIDFMGDSKTVDVHIRWLREKVEADPSAPQLILTVRGFGYRFG
jgi:two-component system phosphate regulon response regulator PhoB